MDTLRQLFHSWAGEPCLRFLAIGASGASSRHYYRLQGATHSCIGTIASDLRENKAFFAFTRHLFAKGQPVPELYAVASDGCHYLQQDLGDLTLYGLLFEKRRQGRGFDSQMLALYKQALADLANLQLAGRDLDFSLAYPRPSFDSQSMLWDLYYFKYNYLKIANIPFDEQALEDDFLSLTHYLLSADDSYFLYRDFQGRNIMFTPDTSPTLHYIDYQGGRRGAAQYDVASFLYSAKSDLPETIRQELLRHYLDIRGLHDADRQQWTSHYYAYVLHRILQTLGAYGYRGLVQRKTYFLESIPLAITNLRTLLLTHPIDLSLPELMRVVDRLVKSQAASSPTAPEADGLTVSVQSFSYRRGLPDDPSGNGGGHIFDCRALPNPGRYPEYKAYTGCDQPVIDFLREQPPVADFLAHAKAIVAQSVQCYLDRHFTHLSVAFGCTGGQHRSVYCAEQLAHWLRSTYPQCNVQLRHREQENGA